LRDHQRGLVVQDPSHVLEGREDIARPRRFSLPTR
jgi:hypothetical protein